MSFNTNLTSVSLQNVQTKCQLNDNDIYRCISTIEKWELLEPEL